MKLTPAHLKFLLIKGLHLLVVVVVTFFLIAYCHQGNQKEKASQTEEIPVRQDETLSAYQDLCNADENENCGTVQSFISEEGSSAEVILMDTDEFEHDITEKITEVAEAGMETTVKPQNMPVLLEKLYEENLPDDVIDEITATHHVAKHSKSLSKNQKPSFGDKPVLVIVIDDMGISKKHTAEITSLKYPLTAAFLTYGQQLEEQVNHSIAAGQEIMLHTPMEPQTKADLAPDTLTTAMSLKEIKTNFEKMLKNFPWIKGINNHMGSKLTEDFERMSVIMAVLKEKGLFFLDSKTSAKSRAEEAAQKVGIPYAHRHVFLDNTNEKTYILKQLHKLESLAQKNGYAIAIGHPKSGTYEALKEWLPQVNKKGFKLMPLSEVVRILNP